MLSDVRRRRIDCAVPKSCMDKIRIRGARTHNLKNLNLELPRNKLVVITGLSGSGKSSLAFDTLYAEGQRRYVESLSAYARQFLQLMEKPDVDLIEGLSPAIAIEQKAASHNPRSTVGTVTEIHDYLRLLFARVGTPYCPDHGLPLQAQTVAQMVDHVLALPEDTRLMVLAPVVAGARASRRDLFDELRAQGFMRVRVDGKVFELDAAAAADEERQAHHRRRGRPPEGARRRPSSAWPSLRDRAAPRRRARDRGRIGQRQGAPVLGQVRLPACAATRWPNSSRACSRSTIRWAPARPATASGTVEFFDPKRVVALPHLCLAAARSRAGTGATSSTSRCCRALAKHYGFDIERRSKRCRARCRTLILYGSGKEEIAFTYLARARQPARVKEHPFEGIVPNLRAALPRDRLGRGARGARQVSEHTSPARTAAARGCGARRATSLRRRRSRSTRSSHVPLRQTLELFRSAAARRHSARRSPKASCKRDRRPARVPGQRRARLPVARPLRRNALGRRGAAHPAGEPDRLRPDRRHVRAGRALHRPAPARQRRA